MTAKARSRSLHRDAPLDDRNACHHGHQEWGRGGGAVGACFLQFSQCTVLSRCGIALTEFDASAIVLDEAEGSGDASAPGLPCDVLHGGHRDVRTTQIYTHLLNRRPDGVRSPADRLRDL
jgi:hypothetical protein